MLIRGIETLNLRIKQHCINAQAIAEFLETHPAVDKVYYPGLKTHFNHHIAKAQSKGFGGIVSFTLKNDTEAAAREFVTNTKYFWESNFYEMESKELLYSVQTKSFNPVSTESLAHEYGKMIVNNMEKKGIINKLED